MMILIDDVDDVDDVDDDDDDDDGDDDDDYGDYEHDKKSLQTDAFLQVFEALAKVAVPIVLQ